MSSNGAALDPPVQARERPAGVLGIALGLALFAGCAALLLFLRPRELDPAAVLASSFELGELPGALALERALETPGGAAVVVISDGRELALDPLPELAKDAPEEREPKSDARAEPPEVDWSKVVEGEPDTLPARVFLVRYGESAAKKVLDREFRSIQWKELSDVGRRGGRAAVEGGQLDWGPFGADFVRERRFEPELRFHDALRVNLARPGRYWVAYAFWPPGLPGSAKAVERVLAALPPAESEPAPR